MCSTYLPCLSPLEGVRWTVLKLLRTKVILPCIAMTSICCMNLIAGKVQPRTEDEESKEENNQRENQRGFKLLWPSKTRLQFRTCSSYIQPGLLKSGSRINNPNFKLHIKLLSKFSFLHICHKSQYQALHLLYVI